MRISPGPYQKLFAQIIPSREDWVITPYKTGTISTSNYSVLRNSSMDTYLIVNYCSAEVFVIFRYGGIAQFQF